MSNCIGKEFFLPLCMLLAFIVIAAPQIYTYCPKRNYLLGILQTNVLWHALEIKDAGWENLPIVLLPCPYCVQILLRRLVCLCDCILGGPVSNSNKFAFEGGLLGGIGLSCKHSTLSGRLGALLTRRCSQDLVRV